MGVGAGLYMCDVVKKSSRSLSHLLMSSCYTYLVEYYKDQESKWGDISLHTGTPSAPRLVRCPRPLVSTYSRERGTTWPLSSASDDVGPTPDHFSSRSTDCQSSNESPKRQHCWRSMCPHAQRQHTWATWHSRSRLHTPGTHYTVGH